MKTVADRIRGRMAEERVSVKTVARLFKITERTWSNWMRDPETQLNIGRIRVIAELLHTTPSELMGEEAA